MSTKKIEPGITVLPEAMSPVPQIFADGIGIMIGIPVSKLQFQSTMGRDEKSGNELRQVIFQATVPTSTLIEFCQNTLKGLSENEETLSKALGEFNNKILSNSAKNKKG